VPPPIPVDLVPHSPKWAPTAARETRRLQVALGDALLTVHHIGSTSIPGIVAKPIVDLIPEVTSLEVLDAAKDSIIALGYEWWGEYGMAGRRYCTMTDPASGKRVVQLHCFATGSSHITRHVAFRDFMRRHPDKAHVYEVEKIRARDLHPQDSHAYSVAKSHWMSAIEVEALAEWKAAQSR
jgi:GrpB-like predicted nucleotidyltransferase (UPF0157 family)